MVCFMIHRDHKCNNVTLTGEPCGTGPEGMGISDRLLLCLPEALSFVCLNLNSVFGVSAQH